MLGCRNLRDLRSIVIFVKYREVFTRTVLPNFVGNCRDSVVFAFWRPQRRRWLRGRRGNVRLQLSSPGQPRRFSMATRKALARSHSRSLQLLCTVGGSQARLDARTEFEILERSPKGGWSCTSLYLKFCLALVYR